MSQCWKTGFAEDSVRPWRKRDIAGSSLRWRRAILRLIDWVTILACRKRLSRRGWLHHLNETVFFSTSLAH
jgi:hypothetical protein